MSPKRHVAPAAGFLWRVLNDASGSTRIDWAPFLATAKRSRKETMK